VEETERGEAGAKKKMKIKCKIKRG